MVITNFAPPMDSALGDRLVRLNGSAGPGCYPIEGGGDRNIKKREQHNNGESTSDMA